MDEIQITGHQTPTAEALLRSRPHEFFSVFLCSPGCTPAPQLFALSNGAIRIEFDDVDRFNSQHICPDASHVLLALHATDDKAKVMFACHAGLSRSAGMALVIAAKHWGLGRAFSILKPGYHHPSRQIVAVGAEVIDVPELWTRFVDWYKAVYHSDPSAGWVPCRGAAG